MASRQPQPRFLHATVGVGQRFYVWGGHGGHSAKIQTKTFECFDVCTETWQHPQFLPSSLYGMAVDTDGECAYTFGGENESDSDYSLYKVDLHSYQCKEIIPANPFDAPKRSRSGMVYYDQQLVIHGGYDGQEPTDELNVFDLEKCVWRIQPTKGTCPPPLANHTFTKIDNYRAVVFGGYTGTCRINDAYLLDMKIWHWTKLKITGAKPPARSFHATCCIAGPLTGQGQQSPLLMVVGGYSGSTMGDVWLLSVDKGIWSEVTLPEAITPRDGHSAAVFGSRPNFKIVVLFGGWSGTKYLSETTLLMLEFSRSSWKVTGVVKPDGLGKPDSRLRVQMKKLQFTSRTEVVSRRSTVADIATGSSSTAYRGISAVVSPTDTGGDLAKRNARLSTESAVTLTATL